MTEVRVLVFGASRQGKSSLINLLAGKEVCAVGAGATGCTFEVQQVAFTREDATPATQLRNFRFFDTVGLNEASTGTVPGHDAVLSLKRLLTEATKAGGGFNLAIMVHQDHGLSSTTFVSNYKLVVETMLADSGIPVLLVKTGVSDDCEEELSEWLRITCVAITDNEGPLPVKRILTNEQYIRETFPLITVAIPAYCGPAKNGRMKAALEYYRSATFSSVWSAIDNCAKAEPVRLPSSVMDLFMRIWNVWIGILGKVVPKAWRHAVLAAASVPDKFRNVLALLGFTTEQIVAFFCE